MVKHLKIEQKFIEKRKQAFNNAFEVFRIDFPFKYIAPFKSQLLVKIIAEKLNLNKKATPRKWYLSTQVLFTRCNNTDLTTLIQGDPYFHSETFVLLRVGNVVENVKRALNHIDEQIASYLELGSGWCFDRILSLDLNIAKYRPLAASSFIELPPALKSKTHSLLNIKNNDSECFLYCLAAFFHPLPSSSSNQRRNRVKPSTYAKYLNEINVEGINFPVSINQIPRVEKLNNIRINVFGFEGEIIPIYISETHEQDVRATIDLLFLKKKKVTHYVLIRDFNSFMCDITKQKCRKHFCKRCLCRFRSEKKLLLHKELCDKQKIQKITMPEEGALYKFQNRANQQKAEFVIYADFESIINKLNKNENPGEHTVSSFAYIVIDGQGGVFEFRSFRGKNAIRVFFKLIFKTERKLMSILKKNIPIFLTRENKEYIAKTTNCELCGVLFLNKKEKIADHNHITGDFRFVLCNTCNLSLSMKHKRVIPVFFHNGCRYDFHFLVQEMGDFLKKRKISCVPHNSEQFISLQISSLRFMDSFKHLPASLSSLVDTLHKSMHTFPLVDKFYQGTKKHLLTCKQVFCYDFVSSFEKYEVTHLPSKERFFNSLSGQHISDADYAHAKTVWKMFHCKNLGQYSDLYLKIDTLLLAEVFEDYRKNMYKKFKLEPAFYLTLPSLSLDSALLFSNIHMELISDYDHYLFFQKCLRGGFCTITKRFSRANTPKIPQYFNPNKPIKEIIYLDKNNLYGAALREFLPVGNFRWLNQEEIQKLNLDTMHAEQDTGYLFEIDLSYPTHLHKFFDEYPPAIESLPVTADMLSDYIVNNPAIAYKPSKVPKLLGTLNKKEKYVCHYRNLQLYKKLGLCIEKIHRVLAFQQAPLYRSYVDFNSACRQQAKTATEAEQSKFLNNSLFGKNLEQVMKQLNVMFFNTEKQAQKWINKPTFKRFFIFAENLVMIEQTKANIKLNKPIACGVACLEISKVFMLEFMYFYLKPKFGERCQLLGSDTDSFILEITSQNLEQELLPDIKKYFDTSNYDVQSPLYYKDNCKVVNLMKNEYPNTPILEWIGLKPKCYSMLFGNESCKNIAKGVTKGVMKKSVKHNLYRKVLKKRKRIWLNMINIQSRSHKVSTKVNKKLAFSPIDDKRYIAADGIHTFAYGNICNL